jgi:enamine deaminase RidA (YjgF/YER057c/UK114 family)
LFSADRTRPSAGTGTPEARDCEAGQAAKAQGTLDKEAENLGMPWEEAYGYAQAIKVGDTIYLSGQLSHDAEGKVVAPSPPDGDGHITDYGNMGAQMAQSYADAKTIIGDVSDMDAAFAVAGNVRAEAYGDRPVVASTIS